MIGEEVDTSTVSVVIEADLRPHGPTGVAEHVGNMVLQAGVAGVDEPIKLGPSPPQLQVGRRAECASQAGNIPDQHAVELAALDA